MENSILATRPAGFAFVRRCLDRSLLRTPACVFALPCAFVAYILFASTSTVGNYALGQASAANGALVAVGPFVALCAAYEMEALRALYGRLTVQRSWWRVILGRLSVTVVSGLGIMLLIYLIALTALPVIAVPGWSFPVLSIVGVITWIFFGAAVSLMVPRLVAFPVALLVPYLALTLPAGWEPLWLRHTTGMLSDCCTTSQVLDTRAFVASVAALATLIILSLCVAKIRVSPAQSTVWVPLLVAAAALTTGSYLSSDVRDMGAVPGMDRPTAQMLCQADVCLWPEDTSAYETNAVAWSRVRQAWEELGLAALPPTIGPARSNTVLPIAVASSNPEEVRVSMAQSLPRALRGCADNYEDERRNKHFDDLTYLLLAHMGQPLPEFVSQTVSVPAPMAADALTIWAETESCTR